MGADAPILHEETNVVDVLEYATGDPTPPSTGRPTA